jgi:hypothetical protein
MFHPVKKKVSKQTGKKEKRTEKEIGKNTVVGERRRIIPLASL